MVTDKDPESPATTSAAYDAMVPQWGQIGTILEGQEAMREAGQVFLPQHEHESDARYADRRNSATLFNMTEKVLNSWVGKPFSQKIHFSKDTPEKMKEWSEDIDLQGNNMGVFLRQWFRDGLAKAFAHVLVEMPRITTPPGRVRTKADDEKERVRPYWVAVAPENVIFVESEFFEGEEVLTHVRIREEEVTRSGFAEVRKERIRVYDAGIPDPDQNGELRVRVRLFEKQDDPKKRKKPEWRLIPGPQGTWFLGVNFIPLVTFYADRKGLMLGKSPIYDISNLNIRHWQSNSDQISCLTVARFPILAISGGTDEDEVLKIGPYQWLQILDPTGRAYYVEHSGAALASGRTELLDLEEQMASYAVEMLKKKKQSTTATGRVLDNREATSPLEDIAIRFNDAVDRALAFTAEYARLPKQGKVRISTEFALSKGDVEAYEFIKEARRNLDLSRAKFLEEGIRLGSLDEEFSFAENEKELKSETNFLLEKEKELAKSKPAPAPAAKKKPKKAAE